MSDVTPDDDYSTYSPPAELEGQLSINELLVEMGEQPIESVVIAEPTDKEIAQFLAEQTGN